jgi:hypothetical protein
MNTQHEFKLISGRFSAAETQLLLQDLVQAKVSHHLRRLTESDLSEEDIKATEKRIMAIETDARAVLTQLKNLAPTQQVDISSLIVVTPVG